MGGDGRAILIGDHSVPSQSPGNMKLIWLSLLPQISLQTPEHRALAGSWSGQTTFQYSSWKATENLGDTRAPSPPRKHNQKATQPPPAPGKPSTPTPTPNEPGIPPSELHFLWQGPDCLLTHTSVYPLSRYCHTDFYWGLIMSFIKLKQALFISFHEKREQDLQLWAMMPSLFLVTSQSRSSSPSSGILRKLQALEDLMAWILHHPLLVFWHQCNP